MGFNVVCSIALIFTGGAVEIYSLSNVGYLASFIPVLVAYYLLRRDRPDMKRPVRLPEFFKYIALVMAALYFVIWIYGGIVYTGLPNAALGGANTRVYYFIGWAILLSYLPLYWYRVKIEDPKHAAQGRADPRRSRWPPATDRGIAGGSGVPPGIAPTRSRHPADRAAGGGVRGAADRLGPCCSGRSSSRGRPRRTVLVISIARVWGTSLGFPNPGLNPTKREWDAQRLLVREAREALEKAGFDASGHIIGTRRAAKRIVAEATRFRADAIVMGADRDRGLLGDFMWSQEPYRVARRARVPVYLVRLDAPGEA